MNIEAVNIWKNGSLKEGSKFETRVISDNLKDNAVFYFSISTEDGEMLSEGNVTMDGTDYESWETNEYALEWITNKLGLTAVE